MKQSHKYTRLMCKDACKHIQISIPKYNNNATMQRCKKTHIQGTEDRLK